MDEQHTESRLREELRHAVDNVQVPSDMWARIRSRHRREPRQRMLAVATSVALIVVLAVAAFPLVRDAAQQRDPVGGTGPNPSATAAPTPGMTPVPEGAILDEPPTGPVHQLATGEVNGLDWSFIAYEWENGICYGFAQNEAGGGAWCEGPNPLELAPGRIVPVAHSTGSGEGQPGFVFGPVRKDAARVRLEHPSGEVTYVEPVGQRAGLAVNFYTQAYPIGTNVDNVRVTALDAAGQELEPVEEEPRTAGPTTTSPPPSVPEAPPESWNLRALGAGDHAPTGAPAILAHGSASARDWTSGRNWTLVAYPMDGGVCFGFLLGADFTPGQGWCSVTAGQGDFVHSPQHLNPSEGFAGMLLGPVDKEATRVRLTYPSGRTVELTRAEGGVFQRGDLPVGFYWDIIPEEEPATSVDQIEVRSFDAAGRQLGTHTAAG